MKRNTIYLAMMMAALLSACSDDHLCIKGDGELKDYVLEVDDFDEVSLSGPIDLTVVQGDEQSLVVQAESQLMEVLEYDVRGSELMVGFKDKVKCLKSTKGVRVIATVPDLQWISIDGDSEIDNEGSLQLADLTIECHGEGEVELVGTVDRQFFVVDGKMEVENFGMISRETRIEVNGKAEFEVNCTDELYIDVNGKADVAYKGNPRIYQDVNGLLDLDDAN
ncbi:head GIN domain-containing protein [Echinicola vietnamensis]|uniref:Putative auto-transporter adhesin head GIN domain-containing protein n=1 Tax=Echinicola vietnamensis (strain DSM 17526 / LMG 23754 / KMM 6221) TaxID=926556 RepID=L0FYP5_ECHVK|nr:head GIN domain-containing protein [Echinicola vietnamensis]AGA78163.1 Protein of unknown function (DUF2807) [Echinicola vietnamensis DSM 17526]